MSPLAETRRRKLTLFAMCLAQGMILLDVTIVNIALPSIQRELHMSPGRLEWVVSAYALTLATLIPLGGTLGDRFGRKRLFLGGMLLFTVASALCAVSKVDLELIGFRALQGVGGAVLSALTLSIITETYDEDRRAGAIGVWAAVAGLGFGLGPVVGGVLLSTFDWSSVFWVNVPFGLLALVLTVISVPESRDPTGRRIDSLGVVLCALGLFLVTLGLVESAGRSWDAGVVVGPIVGGAVVLAGFALWEHRAKAPMIPPALLRARSFATSCTVCFLGYASLTAFMFFLTLLFQDVKGWSALRTGLSWLSMNIPFLLVAQFAGPLHRRFSSAAVVTTGTLMGGVAILGMSQVTTTTAVVVPLAWYALLGLGYGLFVPALMNAAMTDVPLGSSGIASGVLNTSRQVGTSVGLAVLGAIGVNVARANWLQHLTTLSAASQPNARRLTQSVTGGQVHAVQSQLGSSAAGAAVSSFEKGFEWALVAAGILVVAAAVLAALGMRTPRPAASVERAGAPVPSLSSAEP